MHLELQEVHKQLHLQRVQHRLLRGPLHQHLQEVRGQLRQVHRRAHLHKLQPLLQIKRDRLRELAADVPPHLLVLRVLHLHVPALHLLLWMRALQVLRRRKEGQGVQKREYEQPRQAKVPGHPSVPAPDA